MRPYDRLMVWTEGARHPRFLVGFVIVTSGGLGLAGGFLYGAAVGVPTFLFFLACELLGLRLGLRVGRALRPRPLAGAGVRERPLKETTAITRAWVLLVASDGGSGLSSSWAPFSLPRSCPCSLSEGGAGSGTEVYLSRTNSAS